MIETIKDYFQQNSDTFLKVLFAILTIFLTIIVASLYRRYVHRYAHKHHFHERRTDAIKKLGQTLIYFIGIIIASNVLGFGIQGIFLATSSLFAIIGIAFFANWSILSNVTASVLIYFTFPFRIGDRLAVENEPKYNGILKDVTLFYLKIQNDLGSVITIPANVAIQKIITIQSKADWEQTKKKEADAEKAKTEHSNAV